jgi:hypothetical protein
MAPLGCSYRAVRPYMEAYIWRRKQGKRVASMLAMAGDDEGVVPLALPCDPGGRPDLDAPTAVLTESNAPGFHNSPAGVPLRATKPHDGLIVS